MLSLAEYFRIDGVDHFSTVDAILMGNAQDLLGRVDTFLGYYATASGATQPAVITSGYRTPQKNARIPGAAPNSKHMHANAVDLYDPDGLLDDYAFENQRLLERLSLWLEHPSATKSWTHLQRVAPASGRRVFYP